VLFREFLLRYRPVPGQNRLLDVGCGTGEFLRQAREAGWEVLGVEIAEEAIRAARAAGLPVRGGSLPSLGLPEASFDVVTFWDVLDVVPDPVEQAREANRLLVPGGILMLRVRNLAFHSAVYHLSRLIGWWPRLASPLAKQYVFHQVSFNARTLRRTLAEAGLGRIKIANSTPSRGDPYGTLPRGGDRLLQIAKRSVSGVTSLIAAATAGRLLWGSSLVARAVKG
jgi:SAM-dependent methyltransferase